MIEKKGIALWASEIWSSSGVPIMLRCVNHTFNFTDVMVLIVLYYKIGVNIWNIFIWYEYMIDATDIFTVKLFGRIWYGYVIGARYIFYKF